MWGTAVWIAGNLTASGTQGSWQLGQQEIWYSLGIFLPSDNSVPMGFEHGGGTVAWITGTPDNISYTRVLAATVPEDMALGLF